MPAKTVGELVKEIPDGVRPIAVVLRRMVRASAPELEEIANYGMPCYVEPGTKRTVVYIFAAKEHVNLGFYDGVDMKDPKKRLGGTGQRLRHVKVRSVDEARDPALRALVQEAIRVRISTAKPPRSR